MIDKAIAAAFGGEDPDLIKRVQRRMKTAKADVEGLLRDLRKAPTTSAKPLGDDALLPNIPPRTRGRLLRRQDLDSETEIAAESLADQLAAGIRGSVFAESAFSEIFG